MPRFINTELKSGSDSESSDSDLDSDSESSDSDSDSGLGNHCFSYLVFSPLQLYFEMHFLREEFKYTLMVWLPISLVSALYFRGC